MSPTNMKGDLFAKEWNDGTVTICKIGLDNKVVELGSLMEVKMVVTDSKSRIIKAGTSMSRICYQRVCETKAGQKTFKTYKRL